MGELGSSYQDGRVGMQLSRWECWRSSYQDGRVGIQLSRWESWNPFIKMGEMEIQLSRWGINELDGDHTNLYLLQAIFARY
jgi:hypothetical protein